MEQLFNILLHRAKLHYDWEVECKTFTGLLARETHVLLVNLDLSGPQICCPLPGGNIRLMGVSGLLQGCPQGSHTSLPPPLEFCL